MSTARLLNFFTLIFLLSAGYFALADHSSPSETFLTTTLENTPEPDSMCLDSKQQGQQMWCIRDSVRIRSSAKIKGDNILSDRRLMKGEAVILISKSCQSYQIKGLNGYWHQILFDGTQEGWVFYYLSEKRPLPTPPALPQAEHAVRELSWLEKIINYTGIMQSPQEKELVILVEACDFTNPKVRNTAVQEAARNKREDEGEFNLGQVANLYDFAAKSWTYINDPGSQEYIAKASETILNGRKGDCDDFAVLMFSLVTAIGGEARINYAEKGRSGHAFSEVKVGPSTDEIKEYLSIRYDCQVNQLPGFREDQDGNWWMNLDWFDRPQHPGGQYFDWKYGLSFYIDQRSFETFSQI